MDDAARALKPWVAFAGYVLVVVVLYLAQAVWLDKEATPRQAFGALRPVRLPHVQPAPQGLSLLAIALVRASVTQRSRSF